jgi:hypothetical protein
MGSRMLAIGKSININIPTLLHGRVTHQDLNTAEGFGQHVDNTGRRWRELIQNAQDQWRMQCNISNLPEARLEVSTTL